MWFFSKSKVLPRTRLETLAQGNVCYTLFRTKFVLNNFHIIKKSNENDKILLLQDSTFSSNASLLDLCLCLCIALRINSFKTGDPQFGNGSKHRNEVMVVPSQLFNSFV